MPEKEIKPPEYSQEEREFLSDLYFKLANARDQRDQPHPELDGMTYIEYYESNRRKDLSYLPPKKNRNDVRIVTGHTREKDTTLLSTQLNMNFVADVTAFDEDDLMINELGDQLADMNQKSREIENWAKKRPIIYREMDVQGDAFVQELYVEDFREMPLDDIDWEPGRDQISDFSIRTRLKKLFSGCAVRLVNGKKVYLGDIRTEYIEDQDFVAILNVYSRERAKGRYAKWERWMNVPKTVETTEPFAIDGTTYKSWNLTQLHDDQVAEVMVYWKSLNRFNILLNGTMMLPHKYPLTALSPSGDIPMAQGKLEPISDFAYSKGQPAKTKIDQEVIDETTKLMIEAMRQGRKPPMGSKSRKVYGSGIFAPGKITPNMKKGEIFPLLEGQSLGISTGDFSFYQLMKQQIEDKTVNSSYSGEQPTGNPTATQVLQEKEQQVLKLASAIDGVVNLERRLTWLRIYSILCHWTKPVDQDIDDVRGGLKNVYREFSMSTTLENGEKGIKVFRMTTDEYPTPEDHEEEELALSKEYGKAVRVVYLDPEELAALKATLFIIINPTPRSNDKLSQLLFVQNLRTAYELFGPESLNLEYVKQRYAILINEDYNKFFKKMDIMQMLQMGTGDPAVQNAMGARPAKPGNAAKEQALHPAELEATIG